MKTVVLVHGHPDLSAGGAEMAAYSLYQAFAEQDPAEVAFIAHVSPERLPMHAPGAISRVRPDLNEWLYHAPANDWLYQASLNQAALSDDLVSLIEDLEPEIIHFHHYLGFGLDLFRLLRRRLPRAKIVLTLHEYLAICLRDGQMLTQPDNRLCAGASPPKCKQCFPELFRSHFALRETWFKRHFDLIDGFICPSEFLRDRYAEWGLPASKLAVIENAQVCTRHPRPTPASSTADLSRTFGFFGQFTPYKGIDTLLAAAKALRERLPKDLSGPRPRIVVYGMCSGQSEEYQQKLDYAFADMRELVEYRGGYSKENVVDLMSTVGWVVVPSTWWENSPVVIEEAFYAGRPVICSNIGGMREKVQHGVNGLHFVARDPVDLARTFEACAADPQLWITLSAAVRQVPSLSDTAAQHQAFYESLHAA